MKKIFPVLLVVVFCGTAAATEFVTIADKTISGELGGVSEDGIVTIVPDVGEPSTVSADELKLVRFGRGREAEEPLSGVVAYLTGGDRITGEMVGASKSQVTINSRALGEVSVPLGNVLAVEFRRAGERVRNAAEMREEMLEHEDENDIFIAVSGDRLAGILAGFEDDQVVLRTDVGETKLGLARLFGIALGAREATEPPESLLAVAHCTDGSVVTGQLLESDAGVRLALVAGPEVTVPTRRMVEMLFKQGKLVYLSDLEPVEQETRPYFSGDHTWPYQSDLSYDRTPIRLGGETYRKGLGMFSGMTLTYRLDGEFSRFASLVGIDDADVNHLGNVDVRVLADGEERFKKTGLTRETGPVRVDIPVEGVERLTLVVEFGQNMHFGDLTSWADARLVR